MNTQNLQDLRIGTANCDVRGCDAISTCIVGDGQGHPSCERHSRGADSVFPARENPFRSAPHDKAEWINTNDLLTRKEKRDALRDLREHGERAATRGRFPRSVTSR